MVWPFRSAQKGRPDVVVDFVFERGLLFISVGNIGDDAAYDIAVTFDREIRDVEGNKPINDMLLFHRLLFLPPKKKVATLLGSYASYFGLGQPTHVEARASFHDRHGRRYSNVVAHDLSVYQDIRYV